jgi:CubicO group peptidase (beta-lactamase class C family)
MRESNIMKRRTMFQLAMGLSVGTRLSMAVENEQMDAAANILAESVASGQVTAAALFVRQGDAEHVRSFGEATSTDSIFLLASISKPITIAAVMTLFDQRLFELEDPVRKFLPQFTGGGREAVTLRQLFTHCSGLPDQLPENAQLRRHHAQLPEFVAAAMRTPLLFAPGTKYSYSSMGILLASEVARVISGQPIAALVDQAVYQPLNMRHSAMGIGALELGALMHCQVEHAAPESGAGDPSAKDWDWNSAYWRKLGAPWGGAHGSAPDLARFLTAFLNPQGEMLKPETARLMIKNHNLTPLKPRGLGFDLGAGLHGPNNLEVFGHSGSTGTLCWADPASQTVCVVLTTLPATAADPHPRQLASQCIAQGIR